MENLQTMPKVVGTKEAFSIMIEERGIFKKLGVSRFTVAGWKIYIKENRNISVDKMEQMLVKGGAKLVQEAVWKL